METEKLNLIKKQLFYTKVICFSVIAFLLVFAVVLLPKTVRILNDLNEITSEVKQVDFVGISSEMEENLQKMNESLADLDTDALNQAISQLNEVSDTLKRATEPIAGFYEKFGG